MENLNAENVKYGLKCIGSEEDILCADCVYRKYDGLECHRIVAREALALINSQEQRIKELEQCWEHEHASAMEIFGQWSEKCEQLSVELDAIRGAANSYKMHNKQLTEENERLNKEVDRLSQVVLYHDGVTEMQVDEAKADTVRKMQERLKAKAKNNEWNGTISQRRCWRARNEGNFVQGEAS